MAGKRKWDNEDLSSYFLTLYSEDDTLAVRRWCSKNEAVFTRSQLYHIMDTCLDSHDPVMLETFMSCGSRFRKAVEDNKTFIWDLLLNGYDDEGPTTFLDYFLGAVGPPDKWDVARPYINTLRFVHSVRSVPISVRWTEFVDGCTELAAGSQGPLQSLVHDIIKDDEFAAIYAFRATCTTYCDWFMRYLLTVEGIFLGNYKLYAYLAVSESRILENIMPALCDAPGFDVNFVCSGNGTKELIAYLEETNDPLGTVCADFLADPPVPNVAVEWARQKFGADAFEDMCKVYQDGSDRDPLTSVYELTNESLFSIACSNGNVVAMRLLARRGARIHRPFLHLHLPVPRPSEPEKHQQAITYVLDAYRSLETWLTPRIYAQMCFNGYGAETQERADRQFAPSAKLRRRLFLSDNNDVMTFLFKKDRLTITDMGWLMSQVSREVVMQLMTVYDNKALANNHARVLGTNVDPHRVD